MSCQQDNGLATSYMYSLKQDMERLQTIEHVILMMTGASGLVHM